MTEEITPNQDVPATVSDKLWIAFQKMFGDNAKSMYDQAMAEMAQVPPAQSLEQSAPSQENPEVMLQVDEPTHTTGDEPLVQGPLYGEEFVKGPQEGAQPPAPEPEEKKPSLFELLQSAMSADHSNNPEDELLMGILGMVLAAAMKDELEALDRALEEAQRQLEQQEQQVQPEQQEQSQESPEVMLQTAEPAITTGEVGPQYATMTVDEPTNTTGEAGPQYASADVQFVPVDLAEKPDLDSIKPKTSFELAAESQYDKMMANRDPDAGPLTLGDLQKVGVNMKTDLRPTLTALTKDNPEKLSELAPKGLGDEKAPVSRELAVALMARANERQAIMSNQMQR